MESMHVFYNCKSWHLIIKNLIEPLLIKEKECGCITDWYLFLSKSQGDHITLKLENPINIIELKFRLFRFMNLFIMNNQSKPITVTYPLQVFFMNYENNSVRFNINHTFIGNNFIPIRKAISNVIVRILSKEEIDNESIFTFLIYMQAGVIKSYFKCINDAAFEVSQILSNLFEGSSYQDSLEFDTIEYDFLLKENSSTLMEIILDIWHNESEFDWINSWVNTCQVELKKIELKDAFYQVSELLYEHIGLGDTPFTNLSLQVFSQLLKKHGT